MLGISVVYSVASVVALVWAAFYLASPKDVSVKSVVQPPVGLPGQVVQQGRVALAGQAAPVAEQPQAAARVVRIAARLVQAARVGQIVARKELAVPVAPKVQVVHMVPMAPMAPMALGVLKVLAALKAMTTVLVAPKVQAALVVPMARVAPKVQAVHMVPMVQVAPRVAMRAERQLIQW
jgi:hypothetical protein